MHTIQQHWKLFLLEGILLVILGLFAISTPVLSSLSVELFLGWLLIIGGVVQGYRAIVARGTRGFYGWLFLAVLAIIAGILLLVYPLTGMFTLTILLATYFLIDGIAKIAIGIQWRILPSWGWIVLSGIMGLILSGIIFAGLPGSALWVLGLLLGINLIFYGWSLIALALTARKT